MKLMVLVAALCGACDSSNTASGAGCVGKERCACYGNKTCDMPLICLSDVCVAPAGTVVPGAAGAASVYTEPGNAGSPVILRGDAAGAEAISGTGGWGAIFGASGAPAIPSLGGSPVIGAAGAPEPTGSGGALVVGLGGASNGGAPVVVSGGAVATGIGGAANGGALATASGGTVITASGGKVGSGGATTLIGRGGASTTGGSSSTISARGGSPAYGGSSSSLPKGPNLIKDPTFQSFSTYWHVKLNEGDSGTYTAPPDTTDVCVTNTSDATLSYMLAFSLGYPVSASSDSFSISEGTTYTFSYVVKATGLLEFESKVGESVSPYAAIESFTSDIVTTSYKTFTHTFTPAGGISTAGLVFNVVLDLPGKICFQQVSLTAATN